MPYKVHGRDAVTKQPRSRLIPEAASEEIARARARELGIEVEKIEALPPTPEFSAHGLSAMADEPQPTSSFHEAMAVPSVGGAASVPVVRGYEILGVLGRGGMGVAYKARQVKANRLVALKMILAGGHATEQELSRFRTEAEALARLQHPDIVQIFDVGEAEGKPYFSLEYVEGGSLALQLHGRLWEPHHAAELVERLARAIFASHERGVVHRDLKPANVLMTAEGQPKITDFGLAKLLDGGAGQTASGVILGTPSYMAPEQAVSKKGPVGPAADIYALGAILYELLAGRPPFRGDTALALAAFASTICCRCVYAAIFRVLNKRRISWRRL